MPDTKGIRVDGQPSITQVTTEQDPRDSGHLLGPHVVGQRVVVRRRLRGETGPSGGPALTDLLGVCVAWGDGACVVQPESGESVSIALADIVSGKPVPPRPSVRQRVSVRDAESHTAGLWSSVEQTPLGEWSLRTDVAPVGRLRRRGNSCLAVGDPGLPWAEAAERVRAFYEERDRPVWVQVEAHSVVEAALQELGWGPMDPTGEAEFRIASVAACRRLLGRVPEPRGLGLAEDGRRAAAAVVEAGLVETIEVAAGLAAVADDWLGMHAVEVAADRRRSGLATTIVASLLEWGAEQGATTAWVHVETDNPGAAAFWNRLGFVPHHVCRYLQPSI